MLVVLPMTTATGRWIDRNPNLYYRLNAGTAGLSRDSTVLVDQIRSIDITRISGYIGSLTNEQYQPIEMALKLLFRLVWLVGRAIGEVGAIGMPVSPDSLQWKRI
jgi:mRNA interferase MazF